MDTLRADYLGSYGFDGPVSPNLDEFGRSSIIFNQAISAAPWTKPSVASLFTSLHPQTHRVNDHFDLNVKKTPEKYKSNVLPPEAVTMAEVLRENGYHTAGFIGNDFLIRQFGYNQGFNRYFEPRPKSDIFSATPLLNKGITLLEKNKIKEPYFLYFHLMDVHGPYQCSDTDFDALIDSSSLGEDQKLTRNQRMLIPGELTRDVPWRGGERGMQLKNWRACYAAGIKKFDRRFGAFMEKLKKINDLSNTLIIVTSDHGEELFDHERWAHGHTLFSELLRVPLMVRMPGGKRGGHRIKNVVSLLDIMPTVLSQAGVLSPPPEMAGQDLSPYLRGKKIKTPKKAFSTATRQSPSIVAVQSDRHKLIWNFPKGTPLFYDLKSDPLEKKNISANSKQKDNLIHAIQVHLQSLEIKKKLLQKAVIIPEETKEKLKALGYLQ